MRCDLFIPQGEFTFRRTRYIQLCICMCVFGRGCENVNSFQLKHRAMCNLVTQQPVTAFTHTHTHTQTQVKLTGATVDISVNVIFRWGKLLVITDFRLRKCTVRFRLDAFCLIRNVPCSILPFVLNSNRNELQDQKVETKIPFILIPFMQILMAT